MSDIKRAVTLLRKMKKQEQKKNSTQDTQRQETCFI